MGLWNPPCSPIVREWYARQKIQETLVPILEEVMEEAKMSFRNLRLVSVASGPGSYMGTRQGIAVARALRLCWGVPVAKIPSLRVWAEALKIQKTFQGVCVVILKAGRGRFYVQVFPPSEGASKIHNVSEGQLTSCLPAPPFVLTGEPPIQRHCPLGAVALVEAFARLGRRSD